VRKEIKFRAWDTQAKCMLGGGGMQLNATTGELNHLPSVIPMQYTGLKDKDGRGIYEGDIIRHTRFNWSAEGYSEHQTNLILAAIVSWDEERCAFRAEGKLEEGGGFGWGFPLGSDKRADRTEVEVIGNIYENPELLKEEQ